jgi:hypothetical protein
MTLMNGMICAIAWAHMGWGGGKESVPKAFCTEVSPWLTSGGDMCTISAILFVRFLTEMEKSFYALVLDLAETIGRLCSARSVLHFRNQAGPL